MSAPHRPLFARSVVAGPPRGADTGPFFPIGRRVFISCPGSGARHVMLTDEKGAATLASLSDRTEVEIVAWRPRAAGGPRYLVKSLQGTAEGWLSATSLRPASPESLGGARLPPDATTLQHPTARARMSRRAQATAERK